MLKYKKYSLLTIILFIIFLFVSCENRKLNYRELHISTAPYIKADALNLKDFAIYIAPDPGSRYNLNIIVYSYSQGKETISMEGEWEFVSKTG